MIWAIVSYSGSFRKKKRLSQKGSLFITLSYSVQNIFQRGSLLSTFFVVWHIRHRKCNPAASDPFRGVRGVWRPLENQNVSEATWV